MASVTVSDLDKQFGQTRVLKGVSLRIPEGAFAVLVGPSGCGKSTLLRLLAGLEQADSGVIRFGDRDVTRVEPRDRDIAMVFQSYALYPHLTVRDNLAFGLKLRKADPAEIRRRVDEAAAMLGLGPLLDRLPKMLSGGQRQRVAMGRAIVRRPQLFLFDEPLSNLDAALRSQVRVDIRKLHDSLGATSIYVTHDQVEAMTLADVIFVLNKGVVEQAGQPLDIYARPATRFVAGFMGMPAMNFFDGTLEQEGDAWSVGSGDVKVALDADRFGDVLREAGAEGRRVTVGVRPHDVRLVPEGQGAPMEVTIVEALGTESFAHGSLAGAPFVARFEADAAVKKRDRIHLAFATAHLFDAESGKSLRAALPSCEPPESGSRRP
jgi:sn-glycerol 3-phosphate transport system ATP-binding protein/multiple sugar transport system ATP-binding protein